MVKKTVGSVICALAERSSTGVGESKGVPYSLCCLTYPRASPGSQFP